MLSVESPSIIQASVMDSAVDYVDKISRFLLSSCRCVWNVESVQLVSERELSGQGSMYLI